MKEVTRQDIVWMDWAKVIGIYLVVFGHLLQKTGHWHHPQLLELWRVIYLFHMPLFFVLSGYMYKESQSLKKIFLALVVPYIIYQVLFFPVALAMKVNNEGFSLLLFCKQLMGIVLGDGYNTSISFYDCLPCWFIVSMIQVRLFFYFVPINRKSVILLLIICPCILLLLKLYNIDFIFCLDSTLMSIPYFLMGYSMARGWNLLRIKSAWGGYFCALLSLIALLIIYKINGPSQINRVSFGKNILLNYLGGMAGSMMVIYFVLKFKNISYNIKLIARNTLFLIFYHWAVLVVLGFVGIFNLWKLIDNYVWATFMMAMYAALVLLSSIPIISFLNKKYPIVLGKKKVL